MAFEGSEKKIELQLRPGTLNLLDRPTSFWEQLVERSHAKILSEVSNEAQRAFLLSESSLFVTKNDIVLITCGQTELINAAEFLLVHFPKEIIAAFFYERKNEIFPLSQSTNFSDDRQRLQKWFDGESLRYGREDDHHLFLFSAVENFVPTANDHTMEVLMNGLSSSFLENFSANNPKSLSEIRKVSGIDKLVQGLVDDHIFEPMGYSLNAIKEDRYCTIHITPEEVGNYASFETNFYSLADQKNCAQNVIDQFQPNNFDLFLFNESAMETPQFEGYILKQAYETRITAGFLTQYFSFYKPQSETLKPHRF